MEHKLLSAAEPRMYVLVFDAGDEVMAALQTFSDRSGTDAATFTAIGALQEATLAYFDVEAKQYQDIPVEEQVEVLVLAGDITAAEDGRMVHAHTVLGRRDGTTVGGHLKRAVVYPTIELVLTETPAHLRRRYDDNTGLALIDLGGQRG